MKRNKISGAQAVKKRRRTIFLVLLFPMIIYIGILAYVDGKEEQLEMILIDDIPEEYMPVYMAAEEEYGVPWYLLAAHHRVETVFSTMDPMISPAGAEGPMQFMPCTFVGWSHPTCEGLGQGDIPQEEKMDPDVIKKYGGYGVDANGDGKADPFDIEDAVFSAANFLSKNGAASGKIEDAVFAYNHSDKYVKDVLHFARKYETKQAKAGALSSRQ